MRLNQAPEAHHQIPKLTLSRLFFEPTRWAAFSLTSPVFSGLPLASVRSSMNYLSPLGRGLAAPFQDGARLLPPR